MIVRLHKLARTTLAIRAELRNSPLPERKLATQYDLSRSTVRKWKRREDTNDRSHRPQTLHTTLTAAQETLVIELRRTLRLPLDELLVIVSSSTWTFSRAEFIRPAGCPCANGFAPTFFEMAFEVRPHATRGWYLGGYNSAG